LAGPPASENRVGIELSVGQDLPMAKPALDLTVLTPDEKLDLIDEIFAL